MHMGNIPFILLKGLMMKTELTCPKCGAIVEKYLNPKPTVDIVIHDRERGLVLVDRKNPPYGNALPGGFIDLGESAEQAAVREAFEETNLRVRLTGLLGVYSAPDRDPRQHTISTVFIAEIIREKLFEKLYQEVPYSVAVDVEVWDEEDDRVLIHAAIYVAKPSHKAMVIGRAGEGIKAIGTAARKEIRDLVDKKVHLELWVKVREDWVDDPQFLHSLGFGAEAEY